MHEQKLGQELEQKQERELKMKTNPELKEANLRYCYETAYDCGESRHAQTVMTELGITYEYCTPQSLGNQFWFWRCTNLPEQLPRYLTPLDADPKHWCGEEK